ncbi:MAG: hypothetical protein WC222_01900 [Parachlamydiales bacterium]|jgi:ABC-2 type transport system permease protein
MRAYLALFKARFSTLVQYRSAAFAGFCAQVFWGMINVMVFTAFYQNSNADTPITLTQAITFVWIGQALLRLVPWDIDKEVEAMIKNGSVAYELVRPIDLYWLWFSRAAAMRVTPTILRALPLFICAWLFLDLPAPISMTAGVAFIVSVGGAMFLSSAITTLVALTLFWTISGEGIVRLLPHVAVILCGLVVPLPLFPDWLQPMVSWQPFRGIIDIPSRIYSGVIPTSDAPFYILFQLAWAVGIVLFGKMLIKVALKKLVIQGG